MRKNLDEIRWSLIKNRMENTTRIRSPGIDLFNFNAIYKLINLELEMIIL